ncbi:hypothetical protein M2451_000167 [Dysgonomonas sp. PFB1-18]|uniref:LVIVD repeat-containing protein n=1 Tax=unclassified Dysgonomonas TaxID=2630389 RepID=UPI0024747739|nr:MULTISPECIES: hypothetical protein [unclassified Dysgonomonas]MDH6307718.1 hypothetical protein [Dysgonomonas sp. PF1-14]MDH6337636.1 hypothetical protein [Dysgonomonas sp. PF1-16]MDH6378860.1 hypothetical protein [Dysgonomonas sp. PFB1-18]MDH6396495.1 hypothetical protein [Dysgonomonas sp. PF1-23]
MKKILFAIFIPLLYLSYGCSDDNYETYTYQINEPVFMDAKEFRNSVKVSTTPQEITNQGKICFYNGYLYISEPEKGIHIIDNRMPENPKNIGFIEILGNADLSVRENILYADAYVDLVWFDMTNPAKPELKGRLNDVFILALPTIENGAGYDYEMYHSQRAEKGVVVGWNLVERSVQIAKNKPGKYDDYASSESGGGKSNGVNGSMSRFSLYKDYLYTVINNQMNIFKLTNDKPEMVNENIHIGWDVETIFNYGDNMFMGTPRGLIIYSVADPVKPEYQSAISHIFGCDPVVVDNNIAYVTIRTGNFCGQNANELLAIDVTDVKKPKNIASYAMKNPKGLGIDNNTLFLCDEGLKIYNSEDPQTLMANKLAHYEGMDGYDVIPYNNILMMIADDGLYQYDYSDLQNIKQISKFPIVKQ